CGEVGPNFVLTESSRLSLGVDPLNTQYAEIVIAIVRCDIPESGHSIIVGRTYDRVQREAVQLVVLRGSADQRSYAFGKLIVVAHRRITGDFAGGGRFAGVVGLAWVGVAPGLPGVAAVGVWIKARVALP